MGVPSGYTSAQVVQAVPTGINSGLVLVATATPSAVASVSINNCFTSTYQAYLINTIITASTGGTNATLNCRFRLNGTDTTTNYKSEISSQYSTNLSGSTGATSEIPVGLIDATGKNYFTQLEIFNPNTANQTTGKVLYNGATSGNILIQYVGGFVQTDNTQFDGITFTTTGTNFTGTIRVYGYANS